MTYSTRNDWRAHRAAFLDLARRSTGRVRQDALAHARACKKRMVFERIYGG